MVECVSFEPNYRDTKHDLEQQTDSISLQDIFGIDNSAGGHKAAKVLLQEYENASKRNVAESSKQNAADFDTTQGAQYNDILAQHSYNPPYRRPYRPEVDGLDYKAWLNDTPPRQSLDQYYRDMRNAGEPFKPGQPYTVKIFGEKYWIMPSNPPYRPELDWRPLP